MRCLYTYHTLEFLHSDLLQLASGLGGLLYEMAATNLLGASGSISNTYWKYKS